MTATSKEESANWNIDAQTLSKVGGLEMERALRTNPINSYEMDKRWFLN